MAVSRLGTRRLSDGARSGNLPGGTNDVVLSPSVKGDKEAMRRYLNGKSSFTP
jgi:hypothetical protein